MEAGAMGKPVVASDFSSTREIDHHNLTGLLVPPNEPDALARSILQILDNPSLAGAMGEAGFQQARQKCDVEINAPAIFAIYDELI